MTIDAIIPRSMGGKYRKNNIRPLCPRCNWLRRDDRRSDDTVRTIMAKKWETFENPRILWWLRRPGYEATR